MTEKRYFDKQGIIVDGAKYEKMLGYYDIISELNTLHEERQILIRLRKDNQGKKTRLKNYLKFEYGVSDEKLREIMTDDKWLGEYDDDGNVVI